jgi:hypothetical protein
MAYPGAIERCIGQGVDCPKALAHSLKPQRAHSQPFGSSSDLNRGARFVPCGNRRLVAFAAGPTGRTLIKFLLDGFIK